jgi:hypothetical protein
MTEASTLTMTQDQPQRLVAEPGCPPEWLEEIVETIGITDGVDLVEWHLDQTGDYIVKIEYGEEEMSFRAGTDGESHGQDYDGTIIDMTTTYQVQWWCAGELYTRLQRAKRKIEDLEANAEGEATLPATPTHS